ncbi:MAG: hypothetical protein K0R67_1506 [Paenibacillus sp.]|jgi:hypothetical protein|nr:hypothetical protein [Paenibacillus sp.]
MKVRDALYNWLQMKIVSEERPEDGAAKETLDFFAEILREDHHVTNFSIDSMDSSAIIIRYDHEGVTAHERFDRELAEQLLQDIISNPKYNE